MYYIVYAILYLFSLLPLQVLYFLSDCFYVLIYYVLGYRKKVVMQNLLIAFPEKTEKERIRIAKNFYHKFIDSFIETLKLLSAPNSFFKKRITGDMEAIDKYYDQGRPVQIHLGHNFNWEWANIRLADGIRYQLLGVYMPISNKIFDKLFNKIRSRNGTIMLSAHNMAAEFLPFRNTPYCLGLVADQSPARIQNAKWFDFFGRKTAFTMGPAKNAIKNDTVVFFAFIERPRRGYYHATFLLAEEFGSNAAENDLTLRFVKYLEETIKKNPDMWLWSHRRWKHIFMEGNEYVSDGKSAN